jgi:holo-[acyl-carrier protein] synthase
VNTLAIGIDMVHVPSFAEQLGAPGTAFAQRTFTARELRQAADRVVGGQDSLVPHLAVRWAGKEAVVKAWSGALFGYPPAVGVDQLDWREIEILNDRWGRPHVQLVPSLSETLLGSLCAAGVIPSAATQIRWHLSLSHEVDYAQAQVHLSAASTELPPR